MSYTVADCEKDNIWTKYLWADYEEGWIKVIVAIDIKPALIYNIVY